MNSSVIALSIHRSIMFQHACMTVWVVPVGGEMPPPLFQHYVEMLRNQSSCLSVEQLPLEQNRALPVHPLASIRLRYHWNHLDFEHQPWQDFQIHRQLLAIIGIMYCPTTTQDFQSVYQQQFQPIVKQCPTALVSRCLAFCPDDQQMNQLVMTNGPGSPYLPGQQPTNGTKSGKAVPIIPIPRSTYEQMSFYLNTLVADMAAELVRMICDVVAATEKKTQFHTPPLHMIDTQADGTAVLSSAAQSPDEPASAEQSLEQLTINGEHPRVSDGLKNDGNVNSHSPARYERSSLERTGTVSAAMNSLQSSVQQNSGLSEKDSGISALGNYSEMIKEKKKIPGRAQKVIGDWCLLSGCWDKAIECYENSVDIAKSTGDLIWQAGAQEGLLCVRLLLLLADAADNQNETELASFLFELPEKMDGVLSLYDRSQASFLRMQSSLAFAKFLNDWQTNSMIVKKISFPVNISSSEDAYTPPSWSVGSGPRLYDPISGQFTECLSPDKIIPYRLPKEFMFTNPKENTKSMKPLITKQLALQTMLKLKLKWLDAFTKVERLKIFSHIAQMYYQLGMKRKYMFWVRELACLLDQWIDDPSEPTPELVKSKSTGASMFSAPNSPPNLSILPEIFSSSKLLKGFLSLEVVRLWEVILELWDLNSVTSLATGPVKERGRTILPSTIKKLGWFSIQMQAMREAIAIAQKHNDVQHAILWTNVYYRRWPEVQGSFMPPLRALVSRLPAVTSNHILMLPSQITEVEVDKWKTQSLLRLHDIVRSVRVFSIQSRPVRVKTKEKTQVAELAVDPFIYNPFQKKKLQKSTDEDDDDLVVLPQELIENEPGTVELKLKNPYNCEILIESVCLVFSDVNIVTHDNHIRVGTLGPIDSTEGKLKVSIPVIGKKSGTVKICGILFQFARGWNEYVPIFADGTPRSEKSGPLEIFIIPSQPLLRLGFIENFEDNHLMLLEGEKKQLAINVQNVGAITIKDWMLSVTEHHPKASEDHNVESCYEHDLYLRSMTAFKFTTEQVVHLEPGECVTIYVEVFGKRGCIGGELHLDYGGTPAATPESENVEEQQRSNDITEESWLRRLSIPIRLSVHPTFVMLRCDILPFWFHSKNLKSEKQMQKMKELKQNLSIEELFLDPHSGPLINSSHSDADEYCLFSIDLKNIWSAPLYIRFHLNQNVGIDIDPLECRKILTQRTRSDLQVTTTPPILIYPEQTKRIAFPITKFHLHEFFDAIRNIAQVDDASHHADPTIPFIIPRHPKDPINSEIPPIPVARDKQFVLRKQDGVASFDTVLAKLASLEKKWLARQLEELGIVSPAPSMSDNFMWWLKEMENDEDDLSLQLSETRALLKNLEQSERDRRLGFWFKDQFFRRILVSTEWVYSGTENEDETIIQARDILATPISPGSTALSERKGQVYLRSDVRFTPAMVQEIGRPEMLVASKICGLPDENIHQLTRSKWLVNLADRNNVGLSFSLLQRRLKADGSGKPVFPIYRLAIQVIQDTSESLGRVLYDLHDQLLIDGPSQVLMSPKMIDLESPVYPFEHQFNLSVIVPGKYKLLWFLEEMDEPWIKGDSLRETIWCREPITVIFNQQ